MGWDCDPSGPRSGLSRTGSSLALALLGALAAVGIDSAGGSSAPELAMGGSCTRAATTSRRRTGVA